MRFTNTKPKFALIELLDELDLKDQVESGMN